MEETFGFVPGFRPAIADSLSFGGLVANKGTVSQGAIATRMETLFRLLPGRQPALIRFTITAIIVLVAFAARFAMGDGTGRYGFIHFILPIVAASLLFDRASGFFAIGLSIGLIASILDWNTNVTPHVTAFSIFCIVGTCLVFVAEGLRTSLTNAHAAQRAADLLLQEMSHRVKNKFAMISAIIGLQARSASPEVKHALEDVAARVGVMATVHNYLQLSRHDGLIDMSEYLPGLCHALKDALCGPRPISLTVRATPALLAADKALITGLIVNELVTNAFKYAFDPDQPGKVQIELSQSETELDLSVTDNGRGCTAADQTGLGTRLVTVLAAQLGGTADWSKGQDGGCRARVQFPLMVN
jgi:two-component sensor histidine kinase